MLSCFFASSTFDQSAPQWMRYPAISPDGSQIVLTYKGDLFPVPSQGGDARQITFHEVHDYKAVWSRDGKQIAFSSDHYGNFDIFLMDVAGGTASRLTYHSNDEVPYDFTSDDQKVIFVTGRMILLSIDNIQRLLSLSYILCQKKVDEWTRSGHFLQNMFSRTSREPR